MTKAAVMRFEDAGVGHEPGCAGDLQEMRREGHRFSSRRDHPCLLFVFHPLQPLSPRTQAIEMCVLFKPLCLKLFFCCCCSVATSCPMLCDPMDCSPPGSSVHGILQARVLECAAISSSRGSSPPKVQTQISCIGRRFLPKGSVVSVTLVCPTLTPWTIAHQAPLSVGFSRREYWSGLSFPSPGDLPRPGIEPACPVSPTLEGAFFTTETHLGST